MNFFSLALFVATSLIYSKNHTTTTEYKEEDFKKHIKAFKENLLENPGCEISATYDLIEKSENEVEASYYTLFAATILNLKRALQDCKKALAHLEEALTLINNLNKISIDVKLVNGIPKISKEKLCILNEPEDDIKKVILFNLFQSEQPINIGKFLTLIIRALSNYYAEEFASDCENSDPELSPRKKQKQEDEVFFEAESMSKRQKTVIIEADIEDPATRQTISIIKRVFKAKFGSIKIPERIIRTVYQMIHNPSSGDWKIEALYELMIAFFEITTPDSAQKSEFKTNILKGKIAQILSTAAEIFKESKPI